MARKDLFSRRRRRRAARVEDRLSDLPDDLLLHILGRLDTRSALRAAALSSRWAHLPRELSDLDLKVTDALPPRYHRCLDLLHEAMHSDGLRESIRGLETIAKRYERRAMRAMVSSVRNLRSSRAHRRARRLSLEIFQFCTSAGINRLVADAVDSWRVEDLEVVAKSTGPTLLRHPVYRFPCGRISSKPGDSRLRSLKLVNCLPPSLEGFTALTKLVLRDLPSSTPVAVYQGVVAACPQLRVLHLVSCQFERKKARWLVLDAPMSEIRELIVEGELMAVKLRSLPKLESLTSVDADVQLCSDAVPCLAHVSLVFSICPLYYWILNHLISMFMLVLKDAISISSLILRFMGPEMWISRNKSPFPRMPNLKKLLVADVPSSWDVSWPHVLIRAAPLLESLHVHVSQCEHEEQEPSQHASCAQPLASQRHCHLKELVVVGFERMSMQLIHLVRFTVDTSTVLCRVALLKRGHVEYKGPWDWEMVSQQSTWSNEDKLAVLDGIGSSAAQIEVVLG
ncbi:uncharacterized protein LOC124678854 [Lolium rigidum]|uniref:uncharacterized protein LOC124678854 n=1 Tax=Lolium rigidum TaxID=89674 RepID=UPI001F5D3A59|nr:uncharacterized protein LOC124678854 [Lolium rigidum]